jgi:hypothetical protein
MAVPDDDARVARIEERVEALGKMLGRHELDIQRQLGDLETRVYRGEQAASERHREILQHIKDEFRGWHILMNNAIDAAGKIHDSRLAIQEAKNSDLKKVAMAVLLAIITGLVGLWLSNISGNHPTRLLPQMAPYHSTEERPERNLR